MNDDLDTFLGRLARRLREPLPGIAAQEMMAPLGRISSGYDPTPEGALQAAVLLVITPAQELIYIRRAADGGAHSGQIAFPGGACEPADPDLAATALREAEEEIGLSGRCVTVLGGLTPLYIPVSNFTVHPFVARVDSSGPFRCQPGEVDEVHLLRIDAFPASIGQYSYQRGQSRRSAPCYRLGGVEVWGATAMITAEFLALWNDTTELGNPHVHSYLEAQRRHS